MKHYKGPPSYEEIAVAAYYFWEYLGRPKGEDMGIWLWAEFKLKQQRTYEALSS